jgi:hypothetical protein
MREILGAGRERERMKIERFGELERERAEALLGEI